MSKIQAQVATITLADGRELEVTVQNPDMVRWDITAAKHKWPNVQDAPMLWATFVTWRAATRAGLYSGTWEEWSNTDCVNVAMDVEDDDEDQEDEDGLGGSIPTAPGPDSA